MLGIEFLIFIMAAASGTFGTEKDDDITFDPSSQDDIDTQITRSLIKNNALVSDMSGVSHTIKSKDSDEKSGDKVWEQEIYFTLDSYHRPKDTLLSNPMTFYLSNNAFRSDESVLQIQAPLEQLVELEVLTPITFPQLNKTSPYYPDDLCFKELRLEIKELSGQKNTGSGASPESGYHFRFKVEPLQIDTSGYGGELVKLTSKGKSKFTLTTPVSLDKMTLLFKTPFKTIDFGINDFYYCYVSYNSNNTLTLTPIDITQRDEFDDYVPIGSEVTLHQPGYFTFEDFTIPGIVSAEDTSLVTYKSHQWKYVVSPTSPQTTITVENLLPSTITDSLLRPGDRNYLNLPDGSRRMPVTVSEEDGTIYFTSATDIPIPDEGFIKFSTFDYTSQPAKDLATYMLNNPSYVTEAWNASPSSSSIRYAAKLTTEDKYNALKDFTYRATGGTANVYPIRTAAIQVDTNKKIIKFYVGPREEEALEGFQNVLCIVGDIIKINTYTTTNPIVRALYVKGMMVSYVDDTGYILFADNDTLYNEYIADNTSLGDSVTYFGKTKIAYIELITDPENWFRIQSSYPLDGLKVGDVINFSHISASPVIVEFLSKTHIITEIVHNIYTEPFTREEKGFKIANMGLLSVDNFNYAYAYSPMASLVYSFTLDYVDTTYVDPPSVLFPEFLGVGDMIKFITWNQDLSSETSLISSLRTDSLNLQYVSGSNKKFSIPSLNSALISSHTNDMYFPTTGTIAINTEKKINNTISTAITIDSGMCYFTSAVLGTYISNFNLIHQTLNYNNSTAKALETQMKSLIEILSVNIVSTETQILLSNYLEIGAQYDFYYRATSTTGYIRKKCIGGIRLPGIDYVDDYVDGDSLIENGNPDVCVGDVISFSNVSSTNPVLINLLSNRTVIKVVGYTGIPVTHSDIAGFYVDKSEEIFNELKKEPGTYENFLTMTYTPSRQIAICSVNRTDTQVQLVVRSYPNGTALTSQYSVGQKLTLSHSNSTNQTIINLLSEPREITEITVVDGFPYLVLDINDQLLTDSTFSEVYIEGMIYNLERTFPVNYVTRADGTNIGFLSTDTKMYFSISKSFYNQFIYYFQPTSFNQDLSEERALIEAFNSKSLTLNITSTNPITFTIPSLNDRLVFAATNDKYFPTTYKLSLLGDRSYPDVELAPKMDYIKIHLTGNRFRIPFKARLIGSSQPNYLTPVTD